MKRTFEIEFPDDLGPMWMNSDNLSTCLFSKEHIGGTLTAQDFIITDVTGVVGEMVEALEDRLAWMETGESVYFDRESARSALAVIVAKAKGES